MWKKSFLSPLNPLHTRPQCQCFHLLPGPRCSQLSGGPLLFLAASWLMAATTLVSSRQMPAHLGFTLISHSTLRPTRLLDWGKAELFCQKQGTRTLLEHILLEGEAVNFSWGWVQKDGEVLRGKFSFQFQLLKFAWEKNLPVSPPPKLGRSRDGTSR